MAVNTALPSALCALPDAFAPVITPNNSGVEMRGSLGDRTVALQGLPPHLFAGFTG